MSVRVFSTPTCPYCKMVKEYLVNKKVDFENIDVSVDKKATEEMIEKSGQMAVPVIDVDGEMIIGFDKNKLAKLLKK